MITLSKKLRKEGGGAGESPRQSNSVCRSIRDRLLVGEVAELESMLPATCAAHWPNPDVLHEFQIVISPDEGFWRGGRFLFSVTVTDEYNMAPPKVKCQTILWHPNISEEGDICLSLLRQNSIDKMGWTPTRRLKDVAWGLNSLFTDLLNFDDPLNIAAAEMYQRSKQEFQDMVKKYIDAYAKR